MVYAAREQQVHHTIGLSKGQNLTLCSHTLYHETLDRLINLQWQNNNKHVPSIKSLAWLITQHDFTTLVFLFPYFLKNAWNSIEAAASTNNYCTMTSHSIIIQFWRRLFHLDLHLLIVYSSLMGFTIVCSKWLTSITCDLITWQHSSVHTFLFLFMLLTISPW